MKKWPYQPINDIIHSLKAENDKNIVIVDMGCGDAKIAAALKDHATVYSFDLVAANDRVTECDMAKVYGRIV